ncbi:MAG: ABC transporter permease [Gemmataceae bacterium]|nr:ABC transporter permease [Gemmataceae bacterium]
MDTPAAGGKPYRVRKLLPYWAVFQADMQQTLRSWVYRVWVLLSLLAAVGCLLYRLGLYRVAGMQPSAADLMSELLHWTVLGSVTLIIILTGGSISSERGTMADSVLSRGISRNQYFLGKWHARLVAILGTYFLLGGLVLAASFLVLHDENLSIPGSLVALGTVAALLAIVISCGVTISAISNSTVLGIAALWLVLYGSGFLLSLLPPSYPSPDRALRTLPNMLRGLYDGEVVLRLVAGSLAASMGIALIGMLTFARRDV